MTNNFCPFINGECRKNCVFRTREISVDAETQTVCRLVSATAANFDLCDIIIRDKQDPKTSK